MVAHTNVGLVPCRVQIYNFISSIINNTNTTCRHSFKQYNFFIQFKNIRFAHSWELCPVLFLPDKNGSFNKGGLKSKWTFSNYLNLGHCFWNRTSLLYLAQPHPILSFSQTFSPKKARIRGQRPQTGWASPQREILYPSLNIRANNSY